ncbi:hypothetical protein Rumeso_02461 [Rubellimicrobium mesophilum DSM 19309]|uniref:Uncharacterized protein n=1 Tax=Rubellimicrobium mesophilum DSM 19309 TaxID=442562 RepID=A0A017HNK9_9RHOB|nr:hypothetical protein Rumeso_02461 [Rubellimicrobium mesophilum DSM 19309]
MAAVQLVPHFDIHEKRLRKSERLNARPTDDSGRIASE